MKGEKYYRKKDQLLSEKEREKQRKRAREQERERERKAGLFIEHVVFTGRN